ncbi:MAG: hypothetical protein EZS28_029833 [Streblomastix strix]|uniref:Uncharacterized protein n=1 Tax=Streblomastix strix TaxID=222440 RepID=A0A5J4UWV9_9EUKA|nr:MAG: hypothetical protein EZS28_029833 [Streblomastix strix]
MTSREIDESSEMKSGKFRFAGQTTLTEDDFSSLTNQSTSLLINPTTGILLAGIPFQLLILRTSVIRALIKIGLFGGKNEAVSLREVLKQTETSSSNPAHKIRIPGCPTSLSFVPQLNT